MSSPDGLEPLNEGLARLLDAERPLQAAPAAAKARLFDKLSAELFSGPVGGGGDGNGGGDGGGAAGPGGHEALAGGAGTLTAGAGAASGAAMGGASAAGAGALGSALGAGGTAAVGGGAVAGTGAAVGGAASGAWATAAVVKLALGVGVASFAVGGGVGASVHAVAVSPPPPPPIVRPITSAPPPVAELPPLPDVPPLEQAEPPLVEAAREVAKPQEKPKPRPPDELGVEQSYVEQARAALARKDPRAALGALLEHERRYPNGQLAEERMALQVVALVGLGRDDDARLSAGRFRAKWPKSLLLPLVNGASAEPP